MRHGRYRFILVFLGVPFIPYIIFMVSPFLQTFQLSLTDWRGFSSEQNFVGLQNFGKLLEDSTFLGAVAHNLIILIALPAVAITIGLFLAFMLNLGGRSGKAGVQGVRGAGFYKIVYFFPHLLSVSFVAVLWQAIYRSDDAGLLNTALAGVGLDHLRDTWLANPDLVLICVITVMVWSAVGFYVVLFNAAMASVPHEIYEAVLLDGASRTRTFFSITMPLLWDTLQVAWVFLSIIALDAFALVYIMTPQAGGPDHASEVFGTVIYRNAFEYSQFGYASAIGVVLFFVTLSFVAVAMRASRRERVEF